MLSAVCYMALGIDYLANGPFLLGFIFIGLSLVSGYLAAYEWDCPSFFIKTQFLTNFATAKNVRNSYFYTSHSFLEIPDCKIMPFKVRGFNDFAP